LSVTSVAPRASIGVVVGEPHLTADDLIRRADTAMYRGKVRGKHRVDQYPPSMHSDVTDIHVPEDHIGAAVVPG
jgi:hypothetical protein